MTGDEAWAKHEEWLKSIDSNLDQISASQARTNELLERTQEAVAVIAQNQSSFSAGLTSLTRQVEENAALHNELAQQHRELAEQHRMLAEQHRRLEQVVEQFLRIQLNGSEN